MPLVILGPEGSQPSLKAADSRLFGLGDRLENQLNRLDEVEGRRQNIGDQILRLDNVRIEGAVDR
ncbi:MAG: hypothetical protein KatS3mg082_1694 [Nitrospiraceae bacterium]|nr:MAG: hypothetical protein KatS3mg082_1694 [Nitrospiraceae bacterium]